MLHQQQHTTLRIMNKKNKTPYLASAIIILIVAILGAFIAEIYVQNKKIAHLEQYREFYSSALMTNVHDYLQSLQEKYDAVLCGEEIVTAEQEDYAFCITISYAFQTDEAMFNMLHACDTIKRDLMSSGIILNNHRDDWRFAMGADKVKDHPLPTTIRVAYNGIKEGNLRNSYPDVYFKTLGVLEKLNEFTALLNSAEAVKQHAETYRSVLAVFIHHYEELEKEHRRFEQSPLKEYPHFLHNFIYEYEPLLQSIAKRMDNLRHVRYYDVPLWSNGEDAAAQVEDILRNWPNPMHPVDKD